MSSQISISSLAKTELVSGVLMIISFIFAIFVANIESLSSQYLTFVFHKVSLTIGDAKYEASLINIVNDGLMTFFFLLIGMELKYHLVLGEYSNKKMIILPTAAAIGGILVPALIYFYFNYNQSSMKGWAIPIATDTAFMLGILSFFGRYVSAKLRAFIIGFSLIDDALALMILAIFYTSSPNILALLTSIFFLIILITLNLFKIKNSTHYLLVGIFLWIAMLESGIHGTLCGAILALIIPVQIDGEKNLSFQKLENKLRPIVYYLILPIFIFINSGIDIKTFSNDTILSNIGLGIILGLFIGKPLGIGGFSYLAIKFKTCTLPENTSWTRFFSICILGGIGFTLSLFIGDLTFESGEPHYIMRSAVIIASLLSTIFGVMLLYYDINNSSK